MKVLVTGGGGFLVQTLCRGLVERGHDVASFNRGHYPALDAIGVRQLRGDLADRDAVLAAAQGFDAVFHNAAKAGAWGSYDSYHSANVVGTRNVLEACRTHGIGRLVYTSTPSVTHRATHPVEGGTAESVPYGEPAQLVAWGEGYAPMLMGRVVDMFYFPLFHGTFPTWMPFWGGEPFIFFSPVFNFADACISVGVALFLIFYRKELDAETHRS